MNLTSVLSEPTQESPDQLLISSLQRQLSQLESLLSTTTPVHPSWTQFQQVRTLALLSFPRLYQSPQKQTNLSLTEVASPFLSTSIILALIRFMEHVPLISSPLQPARTPSCRAIWARPSLSCLLISLPPPEWPELVLVGLGRWIHLPSRAFSLDRRRGTP
jgi:hypothetical protein